MGDDKSNIELIVDLINEKKQASSEIKFNVLSTLKEDYSCCYDVMFNSEYYSIHIPPAVLKSKDFIESFYRVDELSSFFSSLNETGVDYYIKIDKNNIYSIKDSSDFIIDQFQYGLTYEIIEKKEEKISSFDEFSNIINNNKDFPENCEYYKIYCKNDDNIKYVYSLKRNSFFSKIINFYNKSENNIFLTGQRAIGKTTTILYNFYKRKNPFLYINLKYFNNSKNALEKSKIIDFEKNNLFRPKYLKFKNLLDKKIVDYEKEAYNHLEMINNYIYDKTDLSKIKFIPLFIAMLTLIYKKIIEKKDFEKNLNDKIKENIDNIITKIKLIEIPESIINNDLYKLCKLLNEKKIFNLIEILLNYKAYLSYQLFSKLLPAYNLNNIWEFIESIIKVCNKLELEFILILDQFKNEYNENEILNKIIDNYKNVKIIICSSIDDYKIRKAIIEENPHYIIIQDELIDLEDIKTKYKEIFNSMSDKKNKYINLFKNNTREIFDCLRLEDTKLEEYKDDKIKKIEKYFKDFCGNNLARISYLIFIFKNINCFWKVEDYKIIINYIPFKYFTFTKYHKSSEIFKTNNYIIGNFDGDDTSMITQIETKENIYYKINYSMPIVGISLFKFIKSEGNIIYYEQYLLTSNKGAGKGITFEEYIKSKIINSKFIPIKNLKINENIEIWSLFSNSSSSDISFLFEKKLENNKIYFIDIINQIEKMFDCIIIDLINNKILFIQITTSKELTHDVFKREKIKEKSNEAIKYLKGNIIDKNIELDIGFFFIFLKYDIEQKQEFLDESSKKLLNDMNKINSHLEKMKNKCDEENLIYCIYHLSSNFINNNNQTNILYNEIDPNDSNLYIFKKDNLIITENKSEMKKNVSKFSFTIEKRNYIEFEDSSISLKKINLKSGIYIFLKKFYEFYINKFKLGRLNMYFEENNLYSLDELEHYCKSLKCFAINSTYKKNGDYYDIIYYDFESSKLCIENIKNNKKNEFNEEYKKKGYELYFLGNREDIKTNISNIKKLPFNYQFSSTSKPD